MSKAKSMLRIAKSNPIPFESLFPFEFSRSLSPMSYVLSARALPREKQPPLQGPCSIFINGFGTKTIWNYKEWKHTEEKNESTIAIFDLQNSTSSYTVETYNSKSGLHSITHSIPACFAALTFLERRHLIDVFESENSFGPYGIITQKRDSSLIPKLREQNPGKILSHIFTIHDGFLHVFNEDGSITPVDMPDSIISFSKEDLIDYQSSKKAKELRKFCENYAESQIHIAYQNEKGRLRELSPSECTKKLVKITCDFNEEMIGKCELTHKIFTKAARDFLMKELKLTPETFDQIVIPAPKISRAHHSHEVHHVKHTDPHNLGIF